MGPWLRDIALFSAGAARLGKKTSLNSDLPWKLSWLETAGATGLLRSRAIWTPKRDSLEV